MAAKKKPKSDKNGDNKVESTTVSSKNKIIGQKYYKTKKGEKPAQQYLNGLDNAIAARMYIQLDRLKAGTYVD